MFLIFLSSGLFLGWALGANDASNVFGSAVGSKLIKFCQAAAVASIFVVIGAVLQGEGGAHTLGKLGSINEIGGAFTVALAAAVSVFWMTKLKLPVSTTQAIVGAIIGWNFFTQNETDYSSLTKIVSTWITGPILGGLFAIVLFLLLRFYLNKSKIHLVKLDAYIKFALLIVGAFGSYSLGANNIANVVGVFVPSLPKVSIELGFLTVNETQLLFLAGGLSIAVGIITYSKKVMMTVGNSLMKLNSETAIVVVLAHSLVLFVFSSQSLSNLFVSIGLPSIPMVPVSSSQAIVGSILGIGVLKGSQNISTRVIGRIASGWVVTPIIAGLFSFFALFFMSNVFNLKVSSTPSKFIKGDTYVETFQSVEQSIEQKVVEIEQAVEVVSDDKSILKIDAYEPFVWSALVILILTVIFFYYKNYRLRKRLESEKVEDYKQRFEAQQQRMETELRFTNQAKNKLEKEIEDKRKEQKKIALGIIQKNEILNKVKQEIEDLKSKPEGSIKHSDLNSLKVMIIDNLNLDKERKSLDNYLKELNDHFFINLDNKFPGLTDNEKKLCSLLRLKLTSKEIASILNISPKSVEVNRYRLKKKMNLGPDDKLIKVIRKL